jgi:lactaldehyde dehydrogenase
MTVARPPYDQQRMLIDGERIDAEEVAEVVHPYDGEPVGSVPLASPDVAEDAIEVAARTQQNSSPDAYERYEFLSETADILEENAEEMARTITAEGGKPITEARGEVDRAIQTLRLSAEEAKRMFGEHIPMDPQKGYERTHAFTQREPVGVVAAITPFNFPLNLVAHKIGPALAAGNAVVAKPALNTPLCAIRLFEYLEEACSRIGIPAGLVNIVTGEGSTLGDVFLESEQVEAISFTGSTAVGKYLARNAGMKELTLELGGNDPTIVWLDADLEEAAAQVVGGACTNAGQVCNSVERVIVHHEVEQEFVSALRRHAESLVVGDPFDEETDVSSLIDDDAAQSVARIYEATVEQGATVECGGEQDGRLFAPTVLSAVEPEMPAANDEVFGPLIPVISVESFNEAITVANDTEFGLEAGVFTQDIDRAKRAADEIDAGGVNVNTASGFRTDHMPYGGFKKSGTGKEGVKYAVKSFSREKLVGFHAGKNNVQ